ncbi:division/cell wall cluster transcriptional repressor MraZ [Halioxenophilus aromaticivorans]|uniref:Transcriptional regulator MraZ n=2 Tax=Halioxenophilus aromaticivorans TaxID=1306992 RepID=A0AAV3TY62_9ALTE
MDAKGRIAIPTRVREQLSEICNGHIVLTASTQDNCLLIFPKPKWDEIVESINKLPPRKSKMLRRTKLVMLGYANEVTIEDNGRMLIPPTLRTYARLDDKKLMVIGQGENLEIWSETLFNEFLEEDVSDEELPEELANLAF